MADGVKRGDKYEFAASGSSPVLVQVTRVARDQAWADIWCTDGRRTWTKRQPLPLPANLSPRAWTNDDVLALHRSAGPEPRVIDVPTPDMTITEVGPNSYRVVIGGGEPGVG